MLCSTIYNAVFPTKDAYEPNGKINFKALGCRKGGGKVAAVALDVILAAAIVLFGVFGSQLGLNFLPPIVFSPIVQYATIAVGGTLLFSMALKAIDQGVKQVRSESKRELADLGPLSELDPLSEEDSSKEDS